MLYLWVILPLRRITCKITFSVLETSIYNNINIYSNYTVNSYKVMKQKVSKKKVVWFGMVLMILMSKF